MGKQKPKGDQLGILQERGESVHDPLGILKKNKGQGNDPLGILKKKELTEAGQKDSEIPSKPSLENGEKVDAITNRMETSSSLPSNIPTFESKEQLDSKEKELLHDIESLKNSDEYAASTETMKSINEMSKIVNGLQKTIGDKPDLTSKEEVEAYNTRVESFNSKRDEFMSREDEANKALSFFNTYDNYVKEYNSLYDHKKGEKQGKYYDKTLLKQATYLLKHENPWWSDEKIDATAKTAIDKSGVMNDPDAGLNTNIGHNLIKAAQSAITDLLPASARSKTAMATGVLFKKYKEQFESISEKKDDETVELSGIVGRGSKKYTVKRAKEILKERMVGSMSQTVDNLKEASAQMSEASEKKLIQHIDQIDWSDPKSPASFLASSVGQAIGQIPLALISFGTSAEIMETGTTYIDGIEKIKENNPGITYEEIIENNLDDAPTASAFGMLSGMLEFAGAKTVMDVTGAKSVFKGIMRDNFGKRFLKGGASEFGTEFAQSIVTQYGASKVARESSDEALKGLNLRDALSEGISGLLGGGVISSVGGSISNLGKSKEQVIDQAREEVDINNQASVEEAVEKIQTKFDEENNDKKDTITQKEKGYVIEESNIEEVKVEETIEPAPEKTLKEGEIYKTKTSTIKRGKDGKIVVVSNKTGKQLTHRGSRNIINKMLEETDYSQMEATIMPDNLTPKQQNEYLIENSNNPIEIAEAYRSTEANTESFKQGVNQIAKIIEETGHLAPVKESDLKYNSNGKNTVITPQVRGKYIANKNNINKQSTDTAPESLDAILQKINKEPGGANITMADLTNHILSYEGKDNRSTGTSEQLTNLSDKFTELTGKTLDADLAEALTAKNVIDDSKRLQEIETELNSESEIELEILEKYQAEIYENEKSNTIGQKDPIKVGKQDTGAKGETTEPTQTKKTEAAIRKEQLEKDIEKKTKDGKDVKRKGNYIQRVLRDERLVPEFRELAKVDEEYTQHDMDLADKRSYKFIKEAQSELGEKEGLLETKKILESDKKSESFPELMMGPISAYLQNSFEALGMRKEALEVVSFKEKEVRRAGRLSKGISADSSPKEVIRGLKDRIRDEKLEKINEEYKDGTTYNQALKEMQTRIDELEAAYKELQKTGKIDEQFLPEPDIEGKTVKSKELKDRAKTLRKKGMDNLSKYFKSQRGVMPMGLMVDENLITALGEILQSYVLEFEGNVMAAYEKFSSDVAKNYKQISKEDIDKIKNDLLAQSEDVINEFKDKKKKQIVDDILKPSKKETKEERKDRKEASENIVKDINEGKSIEEISDNLSKIAKFDKLDPQVLEEILALADDYAELNNDGKLELASDVFDELMDKLYGLGLKSRSFNEIAMDLWYTAILTGPTTLRRSILGSGITSLMFQGNRLLATPSILPMMLRQMRQGAKGSFANYLNVLKTGKTNVQVTDFEKSTRPYTNALWDSEFKNPLKEKGAKGKTKAIAFNINKAFWMASIGTFRNIVAWDQVIKNSLSEGNYALYEFENTDKGKTKRQRLADTEKALHNDKNEEIRAMVDAEIIERKAKGKKVKTGYEYRRFTEIKNTYKDADIIKKSLEDAAEAAMVGTPKSTLGRIYKGIIGKSEIIKKDRAEMIALKVAFKMIFPFFRILFNWLNAGFNYTLIGYKRGLQGKRWENGEMVELTSFQKREFILKASEGLAVTATLLALSFDWDDEDGIKLKDEKDSYIIINGPLTGDWEKDDDTMAGAEPWSFRYRTSLEKDLSEPIKYQDNPFGFVFAPIGIMHDEMFFNQFGDNVEEKERKLGYILGKLSFGTIRYSMEKSFNQGIKTLTKAFQAGMSGDSEKGFDEAFKLMLNPLRGFMPGIYNQMYAQYNSAAGTPEKEAITWYEKLASKNALINHLIKNDKVDVFGYPVIREFDFPFIPDLILKMATDNLDYRKNLKPWQLLHKYESVVIGRFSSINKNIYGDRLTEQDNYDYKKEAGLILRKFVEENYKDLNSYDAKKLQVMLNVFKESAASIAKSEIPKKKQ